MTINATTPVAPIFTSDKAHEIIADLNKEVNGFVLFDSVPDLERTIMEHFFEYIINDHTEDKFENDIGDDGKVMKTGHERIDNEIELYITEGTDICTVYPEKLVYFLPNLLAYACAPLSDNGYILLQLGAIGSIPHNVRRLQERYIRDIYVRHFDWLSAQLKGVETVSRIKVESICENEISFRYLDAYALSEFKEGWIMPLIIQTDHLYPLGCKHSIDISDLSEEQIVELQDSENFEETLKRLRGLNKD